MKISKRLETIASLIPNNSKVIDVGCDHALLDIYLCQEKGCKCIASDVNQKALDQAKYNILRFHAKDVQTVLTDGLDGISLDSNDIIVISGMGTSTIKEIIERRKLENRMIISTHTDFQDLRKYMVTVGYKIQDEKYVEEKGKHYIIMDFIKGESNYSIEDLEFGPILKVNLLYLENEIAKLSEIIERIPEKDPERTLKEIVLKKLEQLKKRI